jgi:MoxR-like ATPase
MPSAIAAARQRINDVGADGDLDGARAHSEIDLHVDAIADPIELPDGKVIYPPRLHGEPIDRIACALLDMQQPSRSRFLRLVGPPGTGKSQIARAIAHRLWTQRGRAIETRRGEPFYGYAEMSGGPSSDEFTFRYEYVPDSEHPGDVRLIPAAFVEAMQHGWVVMIDEVNTIRDVALLSLNGTLDGRLSLYLPAEGRTVTARPGFAVLIAYNPGLVGASDIPDAWHSRFPAALEVTSNWAALAALGAPRRLVGEAQALDRRRISGADGLVWTPQFRDIEALWRMTERIGERAALAFFASNLSEQVQAGKIQEAEAAAACRMLDQAGYAHLKVSASSRIPTCTATRGR